MSTDTEARITSVLFDEIDFPVPPECDDMEIDESGRDIVLRVYSGHMATVDHEIKFDENEKAILVDIEPGQYSLFVRALEHDPANPMVIFTVTKDGASIMEIPMNVFDYAALFVEDCDDACFSALNRDDIDAVLKDETIDKHIDKQHEWNKNYIKGMFAGVIDGTEDFWCALTQALDNCLVPVQQKMMIAREGTARKVQILRITPGKDDAKNVLPIELEPPG